LKIKKIIAEQKKAAKKEKKLKQLKTRGTSILNIQLV
jgi:hypothetical protein